jgi:hypothetical protein
MFSPLTKKTQHYNHQDYNRLDTKSKTPCLDTLSKISFLKVLLIKSLPFVQDTIDQETSLCSRYYWQKDS